MNNTENREITNHFPFIFQSNTLKVKWGEKKRGHEREKIKEEDNALLIEEDEMNRIG